MPKHTIKVLVLCTGNSCRSILAEALFNHLGQGRVRAYSAGSHPAGRVNPNALLTLERHGVPHAGARSKSWDEFAQAGAPTIDFIFTVCDHAANEVCPVRPGFPRSIHWGIADPAGVTPDEAQRAAFEVTYAALHQRIAAFLALPLETMSADDATAAARQIHAEAAA